MGPVTPFLRNTARPRPTSTVGWSARRNRHSDTLLWATDPREITLPPGLPPHEQRVSAATRRSFGARRPNDRWDNRRRDPPSVNSPPSTSTLVEQETRRCERTIPPVCWTRCKTSLVPGSHTTDRSLPDHDPQHGLRRICCCSASCAGPGHELSCAASILAIIVGVLINAVMCGALSSQRVATRCGSSGCFGRCGHDNLQSPEARASCRRSAGTHGTPLPPAAS